MQCHLQKNNSKRINVLSSSDPHPETLFWHSFWHTTWNCIWHIYSDILFGILSGIYFDILSEILYGIWYLFWHAVWHIFWHSLWHLAEVRQCPLRSGARGWGLAVPAGAAEVRQHPLLSAARGWGTGGRGEGEGGGRDAPLIKSRDRHLAGGGKNKYGTFMQQMLVFFFNVCSVLLVPICFHMF